MEIRLNLIPEYKKLEIEKARSFRFVLILGIELAVILIFVWASIFSFQKIVDINLSLARREMDFDGRKGDFSRIKSLDEEFRVANNSLSGLEKIQKESLNWSILLGKLNRLIPQEITLNGLASKNFKIILSGSSANREILVFFKETLEKEACFKNVKLPLSSLVSRDNVNFQMEFLLDEKCIKKQ
ncbi:MAG: PilN domain-containing protein [Patescibacteria group bacterium]